jgi:hypothetical protein
MMLNRRNFLLGSASALSLSLVVPRPASAAVGAWASQQGGSQDLQTGIVWLDYSLVDYKEPNYWEVLDKAASLDYGTYTDWRVPTLNEMTAAVDHGLPQNCPLWGSTDVSYFWWSSTKKGNKAYGVDMWTGASHLSLIETKLPGGGGTVYSHMLAMFVRKGTL